MAFWAMLNWQRCHFTPPKTAILAALRPTWLSDARSRTPCSPRSTRLPKNVRQWTAASERSTKTPRTPRRPSVDANGSEHRGVADCAIDAGLFVACVEDDVGHFSEEPCPSRFQLLVELRGVAAGTSPNAAHFAEAAGRPLRPSSRTLGADALRRRAMRWDTAARRPKRRRSLPSLSRAGHFTADGARTPSSGADGNAVPASQQIRFRSP